MAFVHGRHTYISVDGDDLSPFTNTSMLRRTGTAHDVTTYGKGSNVFDGGGLKNATGSMGGIYDNTAGTGPAAVLKPLVGSKVELIRRTEGTGSGKPEETVDIVITQYEETNPVADMVTWTCEFQCSDDIVTTSQGA